jgi:hypothetical protein
MGPYRLHRVEVVDRAEGKIVMLDGDYTSASGGSRVTTVVCDQPCDTAVQEQ